MNMPHQINYNKLYALNAIGNLPRQRISEDNKHDIFMESYDELFNKRIVLPGIPNKTTQSFLLSHPYYRKKPASRFGGQRPLIVEKSTSAEVEETSRASFRSAQAERIIQRQRRFDKLAHILHKLPYERTRKEQIETYHLLFSLAPTALESVVPDHAILKELCKVATLETYKHAGLTVFGNHGLHIILKGSVKSQTSTYLRSIDSVDDNDFPSPTPLVNKRHVKLLEGDCFGTVNKVEGREANSKVLTMLTRERCEIMKISVNNYKRIFQKHHEELELKKTKLVQSCEAYEHWPNLSIKNLAALIEWRHIPADQVVVNEGEVAPYITFIKHGQCDVFKAVDALKTLTNKRRVQIHKQVCMGKIESGQSFGEYSMLTGTVFSCSVVATTPLYIGCITPNKLEELDSTTRTLLMQTTKPAFVDTTEEDIQQEFIKQEMEADWNSLKHKVLLQTINWCGIRPGYGKWSH